MKALLAVIALVGVVTVLAINRDTIFQNYSYERKSTVEVKEVEVNPDWVTDDEDAKKAYQDVVRKKELQKQSGELKSQIEALQKEKKDIDIELGQY